jgi:hypothetical protein
LNFSRGADKPAPRVSIVRFDLQPVNPAAPVSDPIEPIVFYIDPATPAKWIPWIKRGVHEWDGAFRAAGFSNALVAKVPGSGDGDWSFNDTRFSIIRWLPSRIEAADIERIEDPRTGQILSAEIHLFHNATHLHRNWYIPQAGAVDERAWQLPLPDSLLGRLLEYVVAHEVGHAIGLVHNFLASSLYAVDSVRSASWVHRMGHVPSIMDYSRFNYVAQPEDHIALDDLVPRVGPADQLAIMWGYARALDVATASATQAYLDSLARRTETTPFLRFGGDVPNGANPGELTEAVGDADAITATRLGFRNLRRILAKLATVDRAAGWDSAMVADTYGAVVRQWTVEVGHVAALVGGIEPQIGASRPFKVIARERQRKAVQFVVDSAILDPFVLTDRVTRRFEAVGSRARVETSQSRILGDLLSDSRLNRITELESLGDSTTAPYMLRELLRDIRTRLWAEMTSNVPASPVRRGAQRAYVSILAAKLVAPSSSETKPAAQSDAGRCMSDVCEIVRADLRALAADIDSTTQTLSAGDELDHLRDLRARLRAVDPR